MIIEITGKASPVISVNIAEPLSTQFRGPIRIKKEHEKSLIHAVIILSKILSNNFNLERGPKPYTSSNKKNVGWKFGVLICLFCHITYIL